jgi:hypothetical protein
MRIEGSHNISLISEALSELANNYESRLMNGRFENPTEKKLICAKLRAVRGLHSHVHAAGLSDVVSNHLTIQ